MQDKYVSSFGKIKMSEERKSDMRKVLENEMALTRKPAKTTRLSSGKKAAIVAAAVTVTLTGVMLIPSARNTIYAAVKAIFDKKVPENAIDVSEYVQKGREERVIPTDIPEASEIMKQVEEQDKKEDEEMKKIKVDSAYFKDETLNKLAKSYEEQGCSIMKIEKDSEWIYRVEGRKDEDWFSEGFFVTYHVGDNATGSTGHTFAFKATEAQLKGFLNNQLAVINYERTGHNQKTVKFDEFWKQSKDTEGNIIYKGSWKGPEPEVKILPSDSARFMDYEVTYDTSTGIALVQMNEGGGIG